MLIVTSGDGVIGTSEYNANSYVWYNDDDTNAQHEYLFIMERSDNDGEGASATEPNIRIEGEYVNRGKAEIVVNDEDWALAKEEEVDDNDYVDNDDGDNQPLKSTSWSIALIASGGSKSDNLPLARVELIDKRFIFGLLTTTNG